MIVVIVMGINTLLVRVVMEYILGTVQNVMEKVRLPALHVEVLGGMTVDLLWDAEGLGKTARERDAQNVKDVVRHLVGAVLEKE